MFIAQDLGKQFIKLTQVKNTDIADDVKDYDGDDTALLACYTLNEDAYDTVQDFANIADKIVSVQVVEALAVMGDMSGSTSCYTNNVSVVVLEDGTMYMDYALHDDIFC
jgi:hypothetical protein